MTAETTCKKCGVTVEQPLTGRPRSYCSVSCRRLSEYEIRRLSRKLDDLEDTRLHLLQPHIQTLKMRDTFLRTIAQQREDVEYSISVVEARLKRLLEDSQDASG